MIGIPDGGALANDLRAFLAGQLVAAHRYTARERLARFVRRHRVAMLVSAAALVGAIVIGVVSIAGLLRARDRAESARVTAEAERATTADRAEVMLLDRASTLAPHDPTRAVALLRQLPPASPHLRRARDIAAMAASYGIARGASATPGKLSPIHHLALSPDGQWLASGALDGTIRLHRLETGATRILAKLAKGVGGVVWTDRGATLCVLAKDGLWRIALATGKATQLESDLQANGMWLGPAADRVRFVDDRSGVLVERSTREGEAPRILARDVTMARGRDDISLVASDHRISVVVGDRETVLVRDPKQLSPHGFAIAPDGLKIATWSGGDVIEWSIDGRELQRYQTSRIAALQYGTNALYAMTESELVVLANGRNTRLRENNQTIVWSDLTSIGPAFVGIDGTVVVIDALGVHVVPGEISISRGIATSPHSTFVATGSLDGRVRWWDLAERSPREYLGADGEPCGIDQTRFYMFSPGSGFKVVDRASGKIQRIDHELLDNPFYCAGMLERHIVLAMPPGSIPNRAVVIDLRTFAMVAFEGITTIRGDRAVDKIVYSRGNTLVERSPGSGTDLVRWVAPEPIDSFITSGRWLAAQARAQLVRIDRTTGASIAVTVVPDAQLAGMTADGRMWWVQDRTLWWWDGREQRAHHQFPAKPHATSSFDDQLGLWLEDGSLWLANRQGVANRAPAGQRNVKFGQGTAVQSDAGASVIVRFLATGEQIIRRSRLSTVIHVADDGTLVVGTGLHTFVYQSSVPLDPAQLASWLDRATNARLDPATGALTWHDPG